MPTEGKAMRSNECGFPQLLDHLRIANAGSYGIYVIPVISCRFEGHTSSHLSAKTNTGMLCNDHVQEESSNQHETIRSLSNSTPPQKSGGAPP